MSSSYGTFNIVCCADYFIRIFISIIVIILLVLDRGGSGISQMGGNGGSTIPAGWPEGDHNMQLAELRILLVYLSESLGRLGHNGGPLGAHFSLGTASLPPVEPPLVLEQNILVAA